MDNDSRTRCTGNAVYIAPTLVFIAEIPIYPMSM
jgi:hypothetical protein